MSVNAVEKSAELCEMLAKRRPYKDQPWAQFDKVRQIMISYREQKVKG